MPGSEPPVPGTSGAGGGPTGPDPFWWRDAERTTPRPVEGGIQIASARGAVAQTWWSRRFLSVLDGLGVGGRLARGKAYARAGQIVSLDVGAGAATAQVQGSRDQPYAVRVGIPAFGKAEWARVAQALAEDASYAAAMLGGELPASIEAVFTAAGLSLFPADARDLALDCSCPDHAVPCKHLAAVCYLLAERFDADPFEVLALRGRDRATLLSDLRTRRAELRARTAGGGDAAPSPDPAGDGPGDGVAETPGQLDPAAPLAEIAASDPAAFWTAPAVVVPVGPRVPTDALLDQVPHFPIAVRQTSLTRVLRPLYQALDDDAG